MLITGCSGQNAGPESSDNRESDSIDLTGVWAETERNSTWMEASVVDDTITIEWVSNDGKERNIYWVGSFTTEVPAGSPQQIVSERNTYATDSEMLASSEATKTFTVDGEQISYSVSALGNSWEPVLSKQSSDAPAPNAAASEGAPSVEIVDSGFGQDDYSALAVVKVRSPETTSVGEFVTVSVNFLDDSGAIVGTEEQVETFSWPGQELVLPVTHFSPDTAIASIDPSASISGYGLATPTERPPLPVLESTRIQPVLPGTATASFEFKNDSPEDLTNLRVAMICYDENQKAIGGGSAYPGLAAAGQTVVIEQKVTVQGTPASCQAFPNYGI